MKAWREARGITQRRLATLLDVEPVTVSRWERGERQPTGRMLELALKGLEVELAGHQQGGQPS